MIYSLLTHQRAYEISKGDVFQSLITLGSGMPYAIRHWELSSNTEYCLGHRVIAVIEFVPVIGAVAALVEWLAFSVFSWMHYQVPENLPRQYDLLAMDHIPEWLYEDPVLSRYTCPITLLPIRYPIGDPNQRTIYETRAILEWIQQQGNSPMTKEPLTEEQLVPLCAIQSLIECRLKQWQQLIDEASARRAGNGS